MVISNRNLLFQGSIFKGYVFFKSFREGSGDWIDRFYPQPLNVSTWSVHQELQLNTGGDRGAFKDIKGKTWDKILRKRMLKGWKEEVLSNMCSRNVQAVYGSIWLTIINILFNRLKPPTASSSLFYLRHWLADVCILLRRLGSFTHFRTLCQMSSWVHCKALGMVSSMELRNDGLYRANTIENSRLEIWAFWWLVRVGFRLPTGWCITSTCQQWFWNLSG